MYQHLVIHHVILTPAERSVKRLYSNGFWGFLDWFSKCSWRAEVAAGDMSLPHPLTPTPQKKPKPIINGIGVAFPITARTATIKGFALEWEIACGFAQQTFFVARGQAPRSLLKSQPILVLGIGGAVTAPGGSVAVVTLQFSRCFSAPLKMKPHILVFQRTATGLFHNSFCYIFLTFLSLTPFKEVNTWIEPLFRVAVYMA